LAAACALSVALLLMMMTPAGVRITEPPFAASALGIVMLQQRPPSQPSALRATSPRLREGSRTSPPRRNAALPAITAAAQPAQAPVAADADNASITPPELPARAPLRLDGSVLRQAIGNSKSTVQQMADASGRSPDTPRASAAEQLAGGVERSGKPDCLAPGASLLELPVRIYQAATSRCKVD
jgi:hypothetical protein